MKLLPALAVPAALAALAAPNLTAQETAEAWLARLKAVSDKPVELVQTMEMTYRGTKMTSRAELLYLDATHYANRAEIETYWPEQDQRMVRIMRTVGDGEKQWNEMTLPATGQGAVQELTFEQVREQARGSILAGRVHPGQQLLALLDYTEPDEVQLGDDSVTLVAAVTEAGKSKLVPMLAGVVPKEVEVVLDRKTGFLRSWKLRRFTGETVLSLTVTDVRFPDPAKIDRRRFVFEPSGEIEERHDPGAAESDDDGKNP
ncbi:MAG: hypothetical protein D6702_12905 [Planctomycetota bacterium]|nr:MAG: hypothetical protein D6702_12905 [Planctomycetota bacterium]